MDDLKCQDERIKSDMALIVDSIESMGMTVEIFPENDAGLEVWDRLSLSSLKLQMSDYSIKKDEKLVGIITSKQMQNLQRELTHYARYLIERAIEEGGAEDGEQ